MNLWTRFAIVVMIGSFPFTIYFLSTATKRDSGSKTSSSKLAPRKEAVMDVAVSEMNRGVDAKARELKDLEVKILENKGSILKLEEDKRSFVGDLESIQAQISDVIKNVKSQNQLR